MTEQNSPEHISPAGSAQGRRRVVQVTPNYPPLLGGLERVVQILATRLAARNDVSVVTTDNKAGGAPHRAVEQGGVRVRRHRALTVAHTSLAPGMFGSLLRIRPGTVVHLHCATAVVPEQVWLSARIRGLKYILHFHMEVDASGPLGRLLPYYKTHLFGRVVRGAAGVIVLTESQRDFLAERYGVDRAKVYVVPNGVAEEFFLPPRVADQEPAAESGSEPDPLRLLFVGRLDIQKNVARLLDAMALVTEPVRLRLVGDGDLRQALIEQSARLGLDDRVEFVGRRHGEDLIKEYAAAELFVLPSDREGMALVVLEAMAAGLPVLATAVPGNIETVEGAGLLAEPTPQALAAAIDTLARDRSALAALAASGSARVADSRWDDVVAAIEDVYEQVGILNTQSSNGRTALLASVVLAGVIASFGAYYLPGPLATVAGLWLILGAPTVLWTGMARRVVSRLDSALLVAFGFAVVTDFVVLLLVNFGGPLVGYSRPLSEVPLAAGFALVNLLIGALSPLSAPVDWSRIRDLPGLRPVAGFGMLCLVLAVAGATRLNNGLGPAVSMVAYTAIAGLLALLLIRHDRYAVEVLELGVFFGAAALLLLTSLRGWLITGHDIQVEYEVYRLNLGGGHWVIGDFKTSYNACLSITLLPLALTKLTAISAAGVWKIVFPLMFAVAPVALFRSVNNLASRQVALLSSALFLTFPTFFTDMAYMARQEIAFVVLGAAAVVMSDQNGNAKLRRYALIPLLAGIVLAHYATAYVLVMVLGSGVVVTAAWRLLDRIGERRRNPGGTLLADRDDEDVWDYGDWDYGDSLDQPADDGTSGVSGTSGASGVLTTDGEDSVRRRSAAAGASGDPTPKAAPAFLTVWLVALTAVLAVAYAGPVTHTSGQLTSTLTASWKEIIGHSSDVGSADTSNSLVGGSNITDAQRMAAYLTETRASTAQDRDQGVLYPQAVIDKYPTPVTSIPDLPLTSTGNALQKLGLPVASLNGLIRFGIAAGIQLLLLIGTAVALLGLRYRRLRAEITPSRDQAALAVGSIAVLVLLTLVPQLTVDYSVLRALQQGIFFFGPFMAAGLLWALRWCGRYRTPVLAAVIAVMAVDLTGVVPRLTGGYQPQLALSDSGQYYDEYFPTPEEMDAAAWLQAVYDRIPPDAQQTMLLQTSQDVFERIQTVYVGPAEGTVNPLMLQPGSYVMLGHAEVDQDRASVDYRGTAVPYVYPTNLLEDLKDKIYVSPGVEIYR